MPLDAALLLLDASGCREVVRPWSAQLKNNNKKKSDWRRWRGQRRHNRVNRVSQLRHCAPTASANCVSQACSATRWHTFTKAPWCSLMF